MCKIRQNSVLELLLVWLLLWMATDKIVYLSRHSDCFVLIFPFIVCCCFCCCFCCCCVTSVMSDSVRLHRWQSLAQVNSLLAVLLESNELGLEKTWCKAGRFWWCLKGRFWKSGAGGCVCAQRSRGLESFQKRWWGLHVSTQVPRGWWWEKWWCCSALQLFSEGHSFCFCGASLSPMTPVSWSWHAT